MSDKCTNSNRCQAINRPKNVLKALEKRAISIRKLLQNMEKPFDQRAWREMNDAVRLAAIIEAIASRAVNLPAADANNSVELLEVVIEQLDEKLTRILAFKAGVL